MLISTKLTYALKYPNTFSRYFIFYTLLQLTFLGLSLYYLHKV